MRQALAGLGDVLAAMVGHVGLLDAQGQLRRVPLPTHSRRQGRRQQRGDQRRGLELQPLAADQRAALDGDLDQVEIFQASGVDIHFRGVFQPAQGQAATGNMMHAGADRLAGVHRDQLVWLEDAPDTGPHAVQVVMQEQLVLFSEKLQITEALTARKACFDGDHCHLSLHRQPRLHAFGHRLLQLSDSRCSVRIMPGRQCDPWCRSPSAYPSLSKEQTNLDGDRRARGTERR